MNYNNELKSIYDNWNFAQTMQDLSRNPMWKSKYGLWTFLSGACNDAASKCYIHINKFAQELIDIDTCNVHALKSIAESVDLGYLCKNIQIDSLPNEIQKLIDLLSIPKHYLLYRNDILTENANELMYGLIAKRAAKIDINEVTLDLIIDTLKNIDHIKNILEMNFISSNLTLKDLLKSKLKFICDESITAEDSNKIYNKILNFKLNYIFENIRNLIKNENTTLIKYKQQKLILGQKRIESENIYDINYFYILYNVIKQNLYNAEYDFMLVTTYTDPDTNENIDLTWLFTQIINIISTDNENYIEHFICYHFSNLILSMIKNDKLKKLFFYKNQHFFNSNIAPIEFNFSEDLPVHDQFKAILNNYDINEIEAEEILNPTYAQNSTLTINTNVNYELIQFAVYIKFINNFIDKDEDKFEFNVLKFNFPEFIEWNPDKPTKYDYENISNKIFPIAKKLTDLTLNISNIRKQIKDSIQYYNFVGTKKIASNVLADYFLNNFSNISSNISGEEIDLSLSSLLTEKSQFSIDIEEYYDNTQYLNISSELGNIVKPIISHYEDNPHYFIDANNMIASALMPSPVYENSYIPCSNFINEYNDQFWNNSSINLENYINFYEQFVPELQTTTFENNKEKFVSDVLDPLFNKIWSMFALSGYNSDDNSEINKIYKQYIGTDEGANKFLNIENKYFPTIAPIQNIDGLIKISEYEKLNIVFLSKIYYTNVFSAIFKNTPKLLAMNDKNGIPTTGWKSQFSSFHGYTSFYEYSLNKLNNETPNKIFDVDGPWSYSILQKTILLHSLNLKEYDYNYLTQHISKNDDLYKDLYLNGACVSGTNISSSGIVHGLDYLKIIEKFKINKIETDYYNNVFTHFIDKNINETNIIGPIYFRHKEMMLSLPLTMTFEKDKVTSILNFSILPKSDDEKELVRMIISLINNCIDFGIFNNLIWVFGKDPVTMKFKLFSAKYYFENNLIYIESESIKFYDTQIDQLTTLNDFVCVNEDYENQILNIILFDNIKNMKNLKNANKDILSANLEFILYKIDLNNNYTRSTFIVPDAAFPSVLVISGDNENSSEKNFDVSHLIWKKEVFDDKLFICYEALNKDFGDMPALSSKYDMPSGQYKIEKLKLSFPLKNTIIDHNNSIVSSSFVALFDRSSAATISLHNENDNDNDNIISEFAQSIFNIVIEYPKCYIKNSEMIIEILPFNFEYSNKNELLKTIKNIADKIGDINIEYVYKSLKNKSIDKLSKDEMKLFRQISTLKSLFKIDETNMELNDDGLNMLSSNLLLEPLYKQFLENYNIDALYENVKIASAQLDLIIPNLYICSGILSDNDNIVSGYISGFSKEKPNFVANSISGLSLELDFNSSENSQLLDIESDLISNVEIMPWNSSNYGAKIIDRLYELKDDLNSISQYFTSSYISGNSSINLLNTVSTTPKQLINFIKTNNIIKNDSEDEIKKFMIDKIPINFVYQNLPILTNCFDNRLQIVIWFKNETGITFINDYAFDLDITCYINDDLNRNKKVGYGNPYTSSKYISWDKDNHSGGFEYLNIDVNSYLKNYSNDMEIVLNVCWNDNSEIINDNMYITVGYQYIKEDIKLDLVGTSVKDCTERSIVFNISHENRTLSYSKPKLYYAEQFILKPNGVGYEDVVPDIRAGFINLTDLEFEKFKNNNIHKMVDDYLICINKVNMNGFDYRCITLFNTIPYTINISNKTLESIIYSSLNETVKYKDLSYKSLCLNDIYFNYFNKNDIDKDTNVLFVYNSFLRPSIFNENGTSNLFSVLKAVNPKFYGKIIELLGAN